MIHNCGKSMNLCISQSKLKEQSKNSVCIQIRNYVQVVSQNIIQILSNLELFITLVCLVKKKKLIKLYNIYFKECLTFSQ